MVGAVPKNESHANARLLAHCRNVTPGLIRAIRGLLDLSEDPDASDISIQAALSEAHNALDAAELVLAEKEDTSS